MTERDHISVSVAAMDCVDFPEMHESAGKNATDLLEIETIGPTTCSGPKG